MAFVEYLVAQEDTMQDCLWEETLSSSLGDDTAR